MATGLSNNVRQASATEETGLARREEFNRELTIGAEQARARYEIEGAILIAKKFPRNEDAAFGTLMRSCGRKSLAEVAAYRFPRGGQEVTGPAVYLAKEAARIWGNIRFGFDIIGDDDENRHIRGWAWDVETNARSSYDDQFKKLVQRKQGKNGPTAWVVPDERDLRELTNRRGAILVRNSLLDLLPDDLIQDALKTARATLERDAGENIEDSRKKTILGFGELGISVEDLETYLEHPMSNTTPHEVANLRQIWKSIKEGVSRWSEYVSVTKTPDADKKPGNGNGSTSTATGDALKNPNGTAEGQKKTDVDPAVQKQKERASADLSDFRIWQGKIAKAGSDSELDEISNGISESREIQSITKEEFDELTIAVNNRAKKLNGD